jgi:hypothetical protein
MGADLRTVPDSRARESQPMLHPVIESVPERVDYIARLMSEQKWTPHSTRLRQKELAAAWGVEESTVRNYSTEAGRQLASALAEHRAAYAQRAIDRLEEDAETFRGSGIPGDAGAAVRCNEVLLKATGFAEPEEDKGRATTLIQVGQVVTSPVFASLLNGSAKKLNGTNGVEHKDPEAAEGAEVISGGNSRG